MRTLAVIKKVFLGAILILSFLFYPTDFFAQKTIIGKAGKGNSYSYSSNGKSKIHITNKGNDFRIEYEGDIQISNDDKDIVSISRGGFIEITKSSFGSRRRILIESDGSQKLIRKYYIGSREKSFNPEGKVWLAEILPEVVRSTTIGAKSRVDRFYKKGGVTGVLSEIRLIDSDYVKEHYFTLLLDKKLNTNELASVIQTAGKQIKSDHYLAKLLGDNQKAFLANDKTITAYINATSDIQSDHYLAQVLKKVINDTSISDSQMGSLMDISKNINSDHYLAQVLTGIMDNRELNTQNVDKAMKLSKQINSDHYKTQVLKKALNEKNISKSAYDSFLSSLDDINSDHYTAEVVYELLNKNLNTESLNTLLSIIKSNVNSDHYASNIFKKMAKQGNLSEDQLIRVLSVAGSTINSDHYLSQTLIAFSRRVNNSSEKVKTAYRNAAKSISSDTYFGRAIKALN